MLFRCDKQKRFDRYMHYSIIISANLGCGIEYRNN